MIGSRMIAPPHPLILLCHGCPLRLQVVSVRLDEFDDLPEASTINESSISIEQVGLQDYSHDV